jgi:high-affinity nickel-transport protein
VLAAIHDARWAGVYLVVFGVGTVVGMMLLTLAMAGPIAKAAAFSPFAGRGLVRVTGLVSLAFGLFLAYRVGIADGLLTGAPHWTPH